MLRERLATATVLAIAIIAGVLWLPSALLSAVFGLFILLAGYELVRLCGVQQSPVQYAYLLGLALAMGVLYTQSGANWWFIIQAMVTLWWALVTVYLLLRRRPIQENQRYRLGLLAFASLLLLVAWASLSRLHATGHIGPYLVLFLLVLIWSADSAAYFAGKAWGKRRLAAIVSPGKTWVGAGGATLAAIVCAFVLWQLAWLSLSLPMLLILCVLVAWLSIGGDLWESLLKRQAGVKDSGHLLPGHGGVLDRIDSLLAAAPAFAVGLIWLEWLA